MEHADLLLFEGMRRGALATSNVARGRHVRRLQIGNNRSSGKASEFLGVCAVCQQEEEGRGVKLLAKNALTVLFRALYFYTDANTEDIRQR